MRPGAGAGQRRPTRSASYSADIHGETATAVAEPNGGPYDGARITVTLVGGPSFQVDGLRSNVPVGP